jgi:hypothetical protein
MKRQASDARPGEIVSVTIAKIAKMSGWEWAFYFAHNSRRYEPI